MICRWPGRHRSVSRTAARDEPPFDDHGVTEIPEIVLPCLDEAEALPAVLRGAADRLAACSSSTTVPPMPPPQSPRRTARGWSTEPRRGTARPSTPACWRPVRSSSRSWTATARSTRRRCPDGRTRSRSGRADLAVGRRVPESARGVAVARQGGQRADRGAAAPPRAAVHDIAPIRVARRQALLALRRRRPRLRIPARAAAPRRCRRAGGCSEMRVAYRARAGGRSKVSGSVRGTAASRPRHGRAAAVTGVHRDGDTDRAGEGARAGPGQDPALPAGNPGCRPPTSRRPRCSTPWTRCAPCAVGRPVVALCGSLRRAARSAELRRGAVPHARPGPAGQRPRRAHRGRARATPPRCFPGRPMLQLGMDTPQADAALLGGMPGPPACAGRRRGARTGRRRRVVGAGAARSAAGRPGRRRPHLALRHRRAHRCSRCVRPGCGSACSPS